MKYKDILYAKNYSYYRECKKNLRFRYDPLPYSGGHRRWCLYRHVKTTQELKWSFAYPEYVRSKRNKNYLPNYWYDIVRSDKYDRSWKNCTKRKHQYK